MVVAGRRVLRRLKDATDELHREAERHVRILDAEASLDDYRRYLLAMAGYHTPIERTFVASSALANVGFAASARCREALLDRDLTSLGVSRSAWALCDQLPDLSTLPRCLGAAYVLEGSTLGGRFILSHLPSAIAAVSATSTAYLAGYGDATGDMWRSFGAVVETAITREADEASAVAGAVDTFTTLAAWLA